MEKINAVNVASPNFKGEEKEEAKNTNLLKQEAPKDSFTKEQKQEIIKEAKEKASGWTILFGIWDTLYYGLRSDKTVAKKFDLNYNNEEDKKLVKKIKKEQVKSTLPAAAIGILCSLSSYSSMTKNKVNKAGVALTAALYIVSIGNAIYNKVRPASSINVDDIHTEPKQEIKQEEPKQEEVKQEVK